jgi:photosystem II stability/assembly factor-like uncharacterized protein
MKKSFIFSTAIFLFSLITIGSNFSSAQGLNAVYSPDGNLVIAVGDNGNFLKSLNGGLNYGTYPKGSADLNAIYAKNAKAWIAGSAGTIMVSQDAAESFTNHNYSSDDLNSVFFVDENIGYVVGDNGTIGKSINGGLDWTAQTSSVTTNLNSVVFTSADNGVACGDNGVVIYTNNGGATWSAYTTSVTSDLLKIDMKGNTLIATGADAFVLKYNGTAWTMIDYNIVNKAEVTGIKMVDENTFYTCGGGGFIRKSVDGGATFEFQKNPMMAMVSDMYFSDANKGWVVASTNNAILRTSNGGTTWQFPAGVSVSYSYTQKRSSSGNIGNPFCLHPQNKNGVFILAGSALYRSLDKGETWTLINGSVPGGSCHSFYVNALDTNVMIATKGSSNGRVIKSTNYGATWFDLINPINLTSYGMPLEQDPNDANTVYLAPDNAPMRKSSDFGNTWITLSGGETGGVFRSPCDVIVQYKNSDVIIVGDGTTGSGSGKVWKSVNGGMNWTLINTVTGSEIPMISNTNVIPELVYHSTWSSGSFWKSDNGGSNFTNLSQTGSLWATDIAKDDPTAVCYDQYGSNSYISLDGGSTFATVNVGSSPAAGMCYLDKANLLIQHGGGVYKLNINYSVITDIGANSVSSIAPESYELNQNYPNPFNPTTNIKFGVPNTGNVSLKVFNQLGKEVVTLVNGIKTAGTYEVSFDASTFGSGIYFYRLEADNFTATKKMILVK